MKETLIHKGADGQSYMPDGLPDYLDTARASYNKMINEHEIRVGNRQPALAYHIQAVKSATQQMLSAIINNSQAQRYIDWQLLEDDIADPSVSISDIADTHEIRITPRGVQEFERYQQIYRDELECMQDMDCLNMSYESAMPSHDRLRSESLDDYMRHLASRDDLLKARLECFQRAIETEIKRLKLPAAYAKYESLESIADWDARRSERGNLRILSAAVVCAVLYFIHSIRNMSILANCGIGLLIIGGIMLVISSYRKVVKEMVRLNNEANALKIWRKYSDIYLVDAKYCPDTAMSEMFLDIEEYTNSIK